MQNDQIYSEIITREDFQVLTNELDLLEKSAYKIGENGFEETLKSSVRESTAALITDKSMIKELRAKLNTIKFIELTLAFDPSSKLLNKISSLVKSSAGANIALDIKIDKGIIGGVVIAYNGKYGDFSLSGKLESVLKNYA